MKKLLLLMILFVVIIALIISAVLLRGNEDNWIKDSKGEWIKHGNPAVTPSEVEEQQKAIHCADSLYNSLKQNGTRFNSQCLGTCGSYAVDVAHNPRIIDDNELQNQCRDFANGNLTHFIELDQNGNVIRIS
jgi:Na+-transporting NADH:ubiquinone oxidoreductase subunit NqrF